MIVSGPGRTDHQVGVSQIGRAVMFSIEGPLPYDKGVTGTDVAATGAPPARPGALIGYARCSTVAQDTGIQRAALAGYGVPADRIYVDEGFTGTTTVRPGLDQALAAVHAGDTLIVPKLDRFARSVPDARALADLIISRGARLQIGPTLYDPKDPFGKMFFNILAAFAEFEVDLIRLRTIEGMARARQRGRLKGKQPKLNGQQRAHLRQLDREGKKTPTELAELFGVSRATIYRELKKAQQVAA
jgi:DNA invertase Pin-like site-specific DNA recombinase